MAISEIQRVIMEQEIADLKAENAAQAELLEGAHIVVDGLTLRLENAHKALEMGMEEIEDQRQRIKGMRATALDIAQDLAKSGDSSRNERDRVALLLVYRLMVLGTHYFGARDMDDIPF